ncbi:BMP family ABC transporter substrate-binding protein [Afifella sp. IM 167]|uniref:BMP family ABC transporter substrate-binding protein n=1 Tax=Afifella sp. IM 167 TaxID=2033586 RepID=UPI001CCBA4E8|nr:BMP family ABC transporter substrate-binding protein [Afifella sp. IM 167]MBZ8135097.1 BMP family ABC transporter substrate-binding protein [Afifella sp. IM 167]
MFRINRRQLLAGSAATLALPGLIGRASAQDVLNVGFVYVGPVGDYGWTHAHDTARKEAVEKFGDKIKTNYVENVAEGPDSERVIRQLAQQGNKLIFTTSFGFMNPTIKVAKQFPDVHFEHATGYKTADNVGIYNARFYEGRAVIGTIAGMMSKTGKAGYVASVPIPEVVMGINAFTLAAQKINPDFKVQVVWVNSWYDPAKEADAAKALIDQGCDIITQHTDSPAPLQAAEQRGVYAFGQASDMMSFAPKAHLTAITDNWGPYYVQQIQKQIDGTWEPEDIWWGIKEGLVGISPYNEIMPADVREAADKVKNDIAAGTLHPFTGPIKDQSGEVKIKDGETIPDADLLGMDWYVEGVQS